MNRLAALIAATLLAGAAYAADKAPFADLGDDSDKPISIKADTQSADFNAETIT